MSVYSSIHHQRNLAVSNSYISTFYVAGFAQYSLLPWILPYLRTRKYESWSQVSILFGLLLSTLSAGQFCGQTVSSQFSNLSYVYLASLFLALIGSYVAMAFVNRFFFLVLFFFVIGFAGSVLTSYTLTNGGIKRLHSRVAGSGEQQQRHLLCFSFSTLISAYMYDNRPHVEFPCFFLALFIAVVCTTGGLVTLVQHIISRNIRKKTNRSDSSSDLADYKGKYRDDNDMEDVMDDKHHVEDIPPNFLNVCYGDEKKARKMYCKMLTWRRRHHIEDIFITPQGIFDEVLQYYPHAIHGYSLDGCGVVYELLGKGDAKGLKTVMKSVDDLVWHFNLRNEHVFRKLLSKERREQVLRESAEGAVDFSEVESTKVAKLMTVIDVGGISMNSITTDVLSFIQKSGKIIDNYYPEQVKRLVVVRAPRWFSMIWSVIAKILPETVRRKVDILYNVEGLEKYIHPSYLPPSYGGKDRRELGEDQGHKEFLQYKKDWTREKERGEREKEEMEVGRKEERRDRKKGRQNVGEGVEGKNNRKQTESGREGNEGESSGSNSTVLTWLKKKLSFSSVPEAYLGGRNSYRYSPLSGRWELDHDGGEEEQQRQGQQRQGQGEGIAERAGGERGEESEKGKGGEDGREIYSLIAPPLSSPQQLEEHGLVLAIQAAHIAREKKRGDFSSSLSPLLTDLLPPIPSNTSFPSLSSNDPSHLPSPHLYSHSYSHSHPSSSSTPSNPPSPTLSYIFLLSLVLFSLSSCLHTSLLSLLPLYLSSPLARGGLGYGAQDLALLFSLSSLLSSLLHDSLYQKTEKLLSASPLRGLRIAGGLLFVSLLSLSFSLRISSLPLEDILHHSPHSLPPHSPLFLSQLSSSLPSLSPLALLTPSFLLSLLFCSSSLLRKASRSLFSLSFSSLFPSPSSPSSPGSLHPLPFLLLSIFDLLSPFLSCILFSLLYSHHLSFPLDASLPFALSLLTSLSLYLLSLLLDMRYRGDFGVMGDAIGGLAGGTGAMGGWRERKEAYSVQANNSSQASSLSKRYLGGYSSSLSPRSRGEEEESLFFLPPEEGAGDGGEEEHVLSIPLGDLSLLLSSLSSNFKHQAFHFNSSRVFNFQAKDELKDM